MNGKSSNALKYTEVVKNMNKTVVFAFKGANYGSNKETKNGIFEYGSFEEYYRKFVCKILNLKVPTKENGDFNIDDHIKSFILQKFARIRNKREPFSLQDLLNKNILEKISNA